MPLGSVAGDSVIAPTALMVMEKFWVASGALPLVAVTLRPLNVPVALGVPLIVATPSKVMPVGSAPVTLKVGAGLPVAVKVCV